MQFFIDPIFISELACLERNVVGLNDVSAVVGVWW